MSRISRLVVSTALSLSAILGTSIAAGAHGAPLPIGHIGLGHIGLTHGLALNAHSHLATPFPGAGSFTSRINGYNIKNVITAGFANGQNYAVNQATGGAVNSGFLTGRLYFGGGSTYFNLGPTYNFAIGSNPFNTGNPPLPATAPSGPNSISFANVGALKHGGGGSGIFSAAAFGKGGTFGTSGAGRAQSSFYKTLAGSSTLAGEKSILSLGPLTGGQFYGSFADGTAGSLHNYASSVLAFGNNPFNTTSFSTITGPFTSYLTFGSTTRMITGGQLAFTVYSPGFNYGIYGISFGNSPFNIGSTGGSFSFASYKNVINLAALAKLGTK